MQIDRRFAFLAAALILGAGAVGAWVAQERSQELPALPLRSTGVVELIYAQPFLLDEGYTHAWRAERPQVSAGYLLVLAVDPEIAYPRQTATSVLYVGEQTAARINYGHLSGRLVVLVPTPVDEAGMPSLDLARTPIWFGAADLPERVDAATIEAELARARVDGVQPRGEPEVQRALALAGGLYACRDRVDLERHAAELILRFAPQEREFAEGLLVPLVGR